MDKRQTKKIAKGLGLKWKNESACGIYKGFWTAVTGYKDCVVAVISAKSDPDVAGIVSEDLIDRLAETGKVEKAFYERNAFRFRYGGTDIGEFRSLLDTAVEEFNRDSFESVCCSCGKCAEKLDFYEINGKRDFLCKDCVKTICNDVKRKRVLVGSVSSSWFPGLVGALAGIHLGLLFWIIATGLGFSSSIPAVLMAVLLCFGYRLLGGSMDGKGVALCSLLGILYFAAGIVLSFVHLVYLNYYNVLVFSYAEVIALVPEVLAAMSGSNIKGFVVEDICAFLTMIIVLAIVLRVMYTRNRDGIVFKKI